MKYQALSPTFSLWVGGVGGGMCGGVGVVIGWWGGVCGCWGVWCAGEGCCGWWREGGWWHG